MDIYNVANKMKTERKTIFDLNLNVTFYARVSTTTEEQQNSIENQISHFEKMIKENPNWNYVEGYVDRYRGENAENRKSFMKMIEDGKEGKFDLILTKEVSRFARNTIDSLTYTRKLLHAGVGVFFQTDNICTIDTDSELRLTIMSSMAADEVRKLSERVRFGHKKAIENGRVVGNNRIYGYEKQKCKLIINESEAEMVRIIFELYGTGDYSLNKIANILYEKGYRSRAGKKIEHNTVGGILQNPKYKGFYCGNKVKIVDYRTKEQRFLPEEDWVMYKDETGEVVPAIVPEELWDKCNELFKLRSKAVKSRGRSFKDNSVFTGKIWCASHEKPFWRTSYSNSVSKGKPVYQWVCSEKRRNGAKACATFYLLEEELYSILSDMFHDISDNLRDYVETFISIYKECDIDNDIQKQIETLETQIFKERKKRDKLLELYMEEEITKQEFTERNTEYGITITKLEEDLEELREKSNSESDYMESIKRIEKYFLTMYDPNCNMSKTQVDDMVDAVIEKIYVVPVNETSMRLDVRLKTGDSRNLTYDKNGNLVRRSGIMFKKMIRAYEENMR
ncbi:MAG: recombinase family protein [Ruminococcaceae bacterium]|nr:recombinase family protein [Oscillospiraceae bacterium]